MPISAMLPTVDAETGGDVVLPISAKQHLFNDSDLSVIQCHVGLSALELRSEQYGTIRAQSCVRGNVNPQISRLGNGPDRDPNPARRSLDLQRQSCSASCEGRLHQQIGGCRRRSGPAIFTARIIPIRACMRDFAYWPAARACLEAEGSGCRIEARSKRQRTNFRPCNIPGVGLLCYKLHRRSNCSLITGIH
jgi:hypothetical protein